MKYVEKRTLSDFFTVEVKGTKGCLQHKYSHFISIQTHPHVLSLYPHLFYVYADNNKLV